MQNTLEFDLRLQEYIELARARKSVEAIAYSRKHLLQWKDTHQHQIVQATALLCYPPTTSCAPYKVSSPFARFTSQARLVLARHRFIDRHTRLFLILRSSCTAMSHSALGASSFPHESSVQPFVGR